MVSIREVRRMWKGKRGITEAAVNEFKDRAEMLLEALVRLANYEANKRGPTSRLRTQDVQLAYLSIMDLTNNVRSNRTDADDNTSLNDIDFGEWNDE